MSEPKSIKDIILDIAIDRNETVGKTFIKCPFIQAELIKQGKLNLDDLNCDEIHNIVQQTQIEDWIDNQDVMLSLHISPRTLQNLRSNGILPYSRINNKIYYRRQDIQRILADNYLIHKIRNEYGNNEQ